MWAIFENLENMKWLKENGCPWGEQSFFTCGEKNLYVKKWLKENCCPWNF